MKRALIKMEMAVFGHCYSASLDAEPTSIRDSHHLSMAVPSKAWAEHTAERRARRSGQPWTVTKWGKL